jgi:hypothetical protein
MVIFHSYVKLPEGKFLVDKAINIKDDSKNIPRILLPSGKISLSQNKIIKCEQ